MPKKFTILIALMFITSALSAEEQKVEITSIEASSLPTTPEPSSLPTTPELSPPPDAQAIKLAKQLTKWKRLYDHNKWVECGISYTESQIFPAALEWATELLKVQQSTTYMLRNRPRKIALHEALGIIINESRFDRCAVGPGPRKFAYKAKLLTKPEGHYSHSLEEWEAVFTHPKFQNRKADVGPGQIVVYQKEWEEVKNYLTINPGLQIMFNLLAQKGRNYRTLHPSGRWPGSLDHIWYTDRVTSYGATITQLRVL